VKIYLIASSGGHLSELLQVREAFQDWEKIWVTFPAEDSKSLLKNESVVWAYHPTNRNIPNLIRNAWLAWRILHRDKPDVILSTGAGVGVPFIWIGYLMKIPTIFIESLTFTNERSLSGKLIYHFVDYYFVQWPDLVKKYSKTIYRGQVL